MEFDIGDVIDVGGTTGEIISISNDYVTISGLYYDFETDFSEPWEMQIPIDQVRFKNEMNLFIFN